jgi:hypothetical protein
VVADPVQDLWEKVLNSIDLQKLTASAADAFPLADAVDPRGPEVR